LKTGDSCNGYHIMRRAVFSENNNKIN